MSKSTIVQSVPLLDVARDNAPLKAELLAAVGSLLDAGQFIGGPACSDLEKSLAGFCGVKFAIGCASGSDALLLALMALDIGPGDEVIVPSFTFFATASAVVRLGARPVFCDIEPETFNLNVDLIERLITPRTKAIIPVHLFGQCCDMQSIMEIAATRGLRVIEDCAQSIGATYRGNQSGSIGDIGCFSFYPTKNLGGFGDGGIITSNNVELADRIRLLANHGMRPRYQHHAVGINSRLDSLQAALLRVKLRHLNRWADLRQRNAEYYQQLFLHNNLLDQIAAPRIKAGRNHVWNQFTIRIREQRDAVREKLTAAKIGTEIYYPIPIHRQPCFSMLGLSQVDLPETDRACREVLSLPIFPGLTLSEQSTVVEQLEWALRGGGTLNRAA